MQICLACAEFREGPNQDACAECGGPLCADLRVHRERLIERRVERMVDQWRQRGVVDAATAARLRHELEKAPPAESPAPLMVVAVASLVVPEIVARPPPATAARAETADSAPSPRDEPPQRQRAEEKLRQHQEKQQRREAAEKSRRERQELHRQREESRQKKERQQHLASLAAKEPIRELANESASESTNESAKARANESAKESSGEVSTGAAIEAGQSLFRGDGLSPGIESLAALDDDHGGTPSQAFANVREYVWWFIGTLLVVAGSIMGVREAWINLAGPARQILVAGALLAYHTGFVFLATLVGRKSAQAGGILGGIAVGLLPVVYVGLAGLAAQLPWLAAAVAIPCVGISFYTLRLTGRRFGSFPPERLPLALLPTLIAELPLAALAAGSLGRAALAFVGLAALAGTTRPQWGDAERVPFPGLWVAGLYTAAATLTLALVGAPDATTLAGGLPAGVLALWVVSLIVVLTLTLERSAVRERYPIVAPVVEVLGLAVAACAALAAALAAFNVGAPLAEVGIGLLTVGAASWLFAVAERHHPGALHPRVLSLVALGALVVRLISRQPAWWIVGSMLAPAGALLYASNTQDARRRPLLVWGGVLGSALVALAAVQESAQVAAGLPWLATAAAAALLASAAHIAGRKWSAFDYLGGIAAVAAALAYFVPLASAAEQLRVVTVVLLGAAVGFAAIGWLVQRAVVALLPFDDLSLAAAALAVPLAFVGMRPVTGFILSAGWLPRAAALSTGLLALAGGLLLLRALRDRSRAISFAGFATLGVALVAASGATTAAQQGLVVAALALGAVLVAAVGRVGGKSESYSSSRRLLGLMALAWPESGVRLFADGLAAASLGAVAVACSLLGSWLGARVDPERTWAIMAGLLLVGTTLLGFFTPGWELLKLRGSVHALAMSGGMVALTALVNRIGRPLPPAVVGRNLTLVLLVLWLAALAVKRIGPWLGQRLGNPASGPRRLSVSRRNPAGISSFTPGHCR